MLAKAVKLYSQYQLASKMTACLGQVVPSFMGQPKPKTNKRLLITSIGWYDAKTESIYAKALQSLGYETYVVTRWDPFVFRFS